MTDLLETMLRRVEALPEAEQDVIAAQIIEILDADAEWERVLAANPGKLDAMAREAMEEHRRGETRPLEELLDEKE